MNGFKWGGDIKGRTSTMSLSTDGTKLVIESSGKIKVYNYQNENWRQVGEDIIKENTIGSLRLNKNGTVLAVNAFSDTSSIIKIYSFNEGVTPISEESFDKNKISFYPNPTNGILNFDSFNIDEMPVLSISGMYFLKMKVEGESFLIKIIKN